MCGCNRKKVFIRKNLNNLRKNNVENNIQEQNQIDNINIIENENQINSFRLLNSKLPYMSNLKSRSLN
jgi:cell division protein FtsX